MDVATTGLSIILNMEDTAYLTQMIKKIPTLSMKLFGEMLFGELFYVKQ